MMQAANDNPGLETQIALGKAYREGVEAGAAWCQDLKKEPPQNPYPPGELNDRWEAGYVDALDDWHHAQYAD